MVGLVEGDLVVLLLYVGWPARPVEVWIPGPVSVGPVLGGGPRLLDNVTSGGEGGTTGNLLLLFFLLYLLPCFTVFVSTTLLRGFRVEGRLHLGPPDGPPERVTVPRLWRLGTRRCSSGTPELAMLVIWPKGLGVLAERLRLLFGAGVLVRRSFRGGFYRYLGIVVSGAGLGVFVRTS